MTDFKDFKGAAKKLDDIDLPREGHEIGVGEDILHGFIDCESRGKGFDSSGRPIILFEPHVFYRCLPTAKRAKAVAAGLAYKEWKAGAYGKESTQYPKLIRAMVVDETAALKACSWGMFQVLGENHKMIGFDTPQAMVFAMMEDEENHLRACVDFIRAAGIDDDLRRLDAILKTRPVTAAECAPAVRVYNGPGYAKNGYHTKMAASLNKWRKIKDTPFSPAEDTAAAPIDTEANIYDGKFHPEVEAAQQLLDRKGWPEVGSIDGKWGGKTKGAVLSAKGYLGLDTSTADLTPEFLAALSLMPDGGREIATARATATVDDLKAAAAKGEAGAKDVTVLDLQQKIGIGTGALGTLGLASKAVDELGKYSDLLAKASSYIDPVKALVMDNIGLILMGVGGFVAYQAYQALQIRLAKHRAAQDVSV